MAYLFIFSTQLIISVIIDSEQRHYFDEKINLTILEHHTFYWYALSGILLQPYFLYQLYNVTHKGQNQRDSQVSANEGLRESAEAAFIYD